MCICRLLRCCSSRLDGGQYLSKSNKQHFFSTITVGSLAVTDHFSTSSVTLVLASNMSSYVRGY